jgi:SAM-dependent methyltransferase
LVKAHFYPPRLFKYLPSDLEGKRILDAGCGYGELCFYIRSKSNDPIWGVTGNPYIIGVDIDLDAIKFLSRIRLYDEAYAGNLLKTREILRDVCFDIAILNNVLEHNPKPEALKILELIEGMAEYILVAVPLGDQRFIADEAIFYKNHLSAWDVSDFSSRGYEVAVEDVAFYPDGFGRAYKFYRRLLGHPAHQQIIAVRGGRPTRARTTRSP